MNATAEVNPDNEALRLRASATLSRLPASTPSPIPTGTNSLPDEPPASAVASPPASTPAPAPVQATVPPQATGSVNAQGQTDGPNRTSAMASNYHSTAVLGMAGLAVLALGGWLYERRRRRLAETEKDSVLWADVQPPGSSIVTTAGGLSEILPESPDPAESARAIYVTAIGETNSRREATLIDLHQLNSKLIRRRERGDVVAAVLLLQQHLVDFRFTSPWVFLELLDLYQLLDRQKEWEIARDAFRVRFGQNPPQWTAPSTADTELADDRQLSSAVAHLWPFREARLFIIRWMLGEPDMRQRGSGPPLLPLGIYRELMLLDQVLDEAMIARPPITDSLL